MKRLTFLILSIFTLSCIPLFAQIDCYIDQEIETSSLSPIVNVELLDSNAVYQVVDEMPEFPGGIGKILQFIADSIHLPKCVTEGNVEGRSIVAFVVNRDGTLSDFNIAVPLHQDCDVEAIRVLKSMPRWKPGKRNEKLVRVKYVIPVRFRRP